jgi:antitoxin component of MazEF toxin-antitoxin module
VTLPLSVVRELQLEPGDELRVEADSAGRIVLSRPRTTADELRAAIADVAGSLASAYAETLVRPAPRGIAERVIAQIGTLGLEIAPIDGAAVETAARLRARHAALPLPDGLVLACGEVLDAEVVWTADDRWPAVSDRARLIRPAG